MTTTQATMSQEAGVMGQGRTPTAELAGRLGVLTEVVRPRMRRFMGYYRNPATELGRYLAASRGATFGVRPYRQYQEVGLPTRITGFRHTCDGRPAVAGPLDTQRKEVVIENDIGWRINTLVDFALGQRPVINSAAREPGRRAALTAAINAVLEASGGLAMLQQVALLAAVHGTAYLRMRPSAALLERLGRKTENKGAATEAVEDTDSASALQDPGEAGSGNGSGANRVSAGAEALPVLDTALRLEIVEAPRVLPILPAGVAPGVPALAGCAIVAEGGGAGEAPARKGWMLERMARWLAGVMPAAKRETALSFELWTAARWQRFAEGVLVEEGEHPLGFVPVVPLVNQGALAGSAGTGVLEGVSEVEGLIGLQDELNTRLSDRASRVTMQSFRMYLAKGVEDFVSRPIGPGQMWASDNPAASIESFGGDAASPSEESHIREVREALDKISGVPPVAAGLLQGKVGNLTSAVALQITLISLLSRTAKRREAIEQMLGRLVRRVLEVLDAGGVVATEAGERGIEVTWPSAIPENAMEKLEEARRKVELGVKRAVVLRELGYEADEMEAGKTEGAVEGGPEKQAAPGGPAA